MMTYDLLRIIVIIIYLIFNIFILSLIKIKLKKLKLKIALIISMIFFSVLLIYIYIGTPFERIWIKFDTIQQSFNYSCPKKEIVKIIEKKDYGIVIYDYDSKAISIAFFKKENDKWLVANPRNSKLRLYSIYDAPYAVTTTISDDEKTKFIIVSYSKRDDEIVDMSVTDSYNTKFEYVEIIEENGYTTYYYYTALKDTAEDYYLLINGNKISVK